MISSAKLGQEERGHVVQRREMILNPRKMTEEVARCVVVSVRVTELETRIRSGRGRAECDKIKNIERLAR